MGVGAAGRAVAATDLPVDDGRPQGVLGAPIRRIHRGIEEKAQECRIDRFGLARAAGQRARDRAGSDRQAEAITQEPSHLAMRQPKLFVENHDQGDDQGAQLHGGRPQGIRGLRRRGAERQEALISSIDLLNIG